jgi:hypothetical protein
MSSTHTHRIRESHSSLWHVEYAMSAGASGTPLEIFIAGETRWRRGVVVALDRDGERFRFAESVSGQTYYGETGVSHRFAAVANVRLGPAAAR